MTDINNIDKLKKSFSKLTSFDEKIDFWEEHNLDFQTIEYIDSEGYVALSLQTSDIQERVKYNRWIIGRWRNHFLRDSGKKLNNVQSKLRFIPKDFELLRSEFDNQLSETKQKAEFVSLKLKSINETIAQVSNDYKDIAKMLVVKFKSRQEDDLFYYEIHQINTMLVLRRIAKLWDLIKFKCYIESLEKSFRRSTINELHFLKIEKYTEEQLSTLLHFLIKEHYIGSKTSLELLSKTFNMTHSSSDEKILWIDRVHTSKNVSRQSLITFIIFLMDGELPQLGILYKFLSNSFSTEVDGSLELEYGNFKKCYQKFKKDGAVKDQRVIHLKEGLMTI